MTSIRILLIDRSHPVLIAKLLESGMVQLTEAYDWNLEKIQEELPHFHGLVIRSRINLDDSLLKRGTQLRFIAREGVGLEHIDLETARQLGIKVLISPEGSKDTVAEHAIGLLLALTNRILIADREVRQGQWNREANRATEIMGKTIGILGYGNMGQSFARKISGFGCQVLTYDKYRRNYGDAFAQEASLSEIWEKADVLSIHIPYEVSNHYFVNADFIKAFRKPFYLINTGRGLVLETTALVDGLKSGKVLGAGLDVIEYEELSFNALKLAGADVPAPLSWLRSSDQVVLAPHIAGWSFESKRKHGEVLAAKIIALLGDK
ncbi:MAG: hydroxyacid dehydrogenase [Saprospiraceae bacterium]|nr:hydroxyacid dehydrogenase [Saprospiraceae bacterium]